MAATPPSKQAPSPDLVKEAPHTTPCPTCSTPVEAADAFCPNCGTPLKKTGADPSTTPLPTLVSFHCKNCSAEVRCEPESRSTLCPFCATPYVVETNESSSGKSEPEFVLGFEIALDVADRIYREWIGRNGLFRPADLSDVVQADGLRGIYLPFWSFTMEAQSRWSASIGEFWYRTETYTTTDAKGNSVQQTRRVQETEWWPLSGGHHAFYSFYLVSASKGLPQDVSAWVEPFQLAALKRYAPKFLSGWLSENESIDREEARARSRVEFERRERDAIVKFLPGDTNQLVQVETKLNELDSDLLLLPIYLRSYRYKGKLYRTLINGQTGKIAGEKPISSGRVALFVLFWLLLIVGIVLLIVGMKR